MSRKKTVVIVAGGKGERMHAAVPKQFLELAGEPILMHTLRKFHEFSPRLELILVLPAEQIDFWEKLCRKHAFTLPHTLVEGGNTRFFSVKNGLSKLNNSLGLVAIHDGVRPLVGIETIKKAFEEAEISGAAIPVVDMIESVRKTDKKGSQSVDRNKYKLVQTPQVFRSEVILKSYEQGYSTQFTDDASVVEAAGYRVKLVEGNRENIKITNAVDLELAEILFRLQK